MRNIAKSLFVVPVLLISMSACNNSGQEAKGNEENDSVDIDWTALELVGEYVFEAEGDGIVLDVKGQNDSLGGPLCHNFREQDNDDGEFRGVLKDSLLVGQYSF